MSHPTEKHPFAQLNEMHQKGDLEDVYSTSGELLNNVWRVLVRVSSSRGGIISAVGQGGSKAMAKAQGAAAVLEQLQLLPPADSNRSETSREIRSVSESSASSTDSASSSASTTISSAASSRTTSPFSLVVSSAVAFTAKQQVMIQDNLKHLHCLQYLAQDHGTSTSNAVYVSIDVEAYEQARQSQAPLLEVGIAWVRSSTSRYEVGTVYCRHFIIEDNLHLHNGQYCPDNRQRFNFGTSEHIRECDISLVISQTLDNLRASGQTVFIVGHNIQADIKWLSQIGCELMIKEEAICDFGKAYQAKMGVLQPTKLAKMLDFYGLEYCDLHNGGNDAYYSIGIFLCTLEGT